MELFQTYTAKKRKKSTVISFIFLCQMVILLLGCENHTKKNKGASTKPIINNESIITPEKVTLIGNSDDPLPLRNIAIVNYSYFFGTNHQNISKEVRGKDKDSLNIDIEALEQPQIMEVFAIGEDKFYNTRLFITPGDSLSFRINNGKITFSGKNAAHYNFFTKLDSSRYVYAENGFHGNIDEYKRNTEAIYTRRKVKFENYLKQYPDISQEFTTQVRAELKFEYLYNLINPRSIKSKIPGTYLNDLDGIISTITKRGNNNEGLLNLEAYLDDTNLEEFNRPELLNSDYFKRSLIAFIRHYFLQTEYLDYTEENFNAELNYIVENLEGELEDYAIGRLISDYYDKGFGQGEKDRSFLKTKIASYKKRYLKPSYLNTITEIEQYLKSNNLNIPVSALNEKVIDLDGDTLKLREVFDTTANKLKVLNFWGPICTPCENDIKKSKAFKDRISIRKNLEFIYISVIDNETFEEWKKRTKSLENQLNTEYQYKMINAKKSKLLDFLKVRNNDEIMIPKYSIINTQGKVIFNNLPKPSDSLAFRRALLEIK